MVQHKDIIESHQDQEEGLLKMTVILGRQLLTYSGAEFLEQIKRGRWNMDSMILSAITNPSLFGVTVKMQIRRTSNHSTSLKAPINWVWKLQKELLASKE